MVAYEHRGDSGIGFRQKDILFKDIGFEDIVTYEHEGYSNIGFRYDAIDTYFLMTYFVTTTVWSYVTMSLKYVCCVFKILSG